MSNPLGDATQPQEEADPHFEPIVRLTEQVETKTNEEDEDIVFKMRAKLFRFDSTTNEWKERGTGDVRLLAHKDTKKIRLVMRRDKTLKVCANHSITSDMKLQANVSSDRSWVWKVAADVSDGTPTSETLAIRFSSPENANLFKAAFEQAVETNSKLAEGGASAAPAEAPAASEEKKAEETTEETKETKAAEEAPKTEEAAEEKKDETKEA